MNYDNPYFSHSHVSYWTAVEKAKYVDTDAPYLDLHLSISNGFISSESYDRRKEFDFGIVNFLVFFSDFPRGVFISHLFRFSRVSSYLTDFSAHN